jgi:hypothetical protein
VASTKRTSSETQSRCGSTVTGLIVVSITQAHGTDNVPIDVPRPKPAVIAALQAPRGSGKRVRNAAALLREFRRLIAKSSGADSELSFDKDEDTDDRDASNVVSGDEESACSASGMVETTWYPADMSSGADVTAQVADAWVTAAPWGVGPAALGGELNGVIVDAPAEALA